MTTINVTERELEDIRAGLKLLTMALSYPTKESRKFLAKILDRAEVDLARLDSRYEQARALLARLDEIGAAQA